MMDYKAQLKLQAYLDGELAEGEAGDVAGWLARDREAVALLAELKMTRQAMADFETGIKLPESREFFWSKIERQILAPQAAEPARGLAPLLAAWRRFLVPATGLAAALMVTVLLVRGSGGPDSESSMSDPGALTYRDYNHGTTLVWLSYPADEEAQEKEPDVN